MFSKRHPVLLIVILASTVLTFAQDETTIPDVFNNSADQGEHAQSSYPYPGIKQRTTR